MRFYGDHDIHVFVQGLGVFWNWNFVLYSGQSFVSEFCLTSVSPTMVVIEVCEDPLFQILVLPIVPEKKKRLMLELEKKSFSYMFKIINEFPSGTAFLGRTS